MATVFGHIELYCEITCSHRVHTLLILCVDVTYRVAVVDAAPTPHHSALEVIQEILYIHTFLSSLYEFNSPLTALAFLYLFNLSI